MNSELLSTPFAALPVRRRETLEIFDTALKLYRRYFWVLLAWSAIVAVTMLTSFFSSILYFLAMPFLYGSVSCCIAGAVRGQNVGFKQCWNFSKPRYGAMLGTLFLAWLIFFAIFIVLYIALILVGVAGFSLLSNAPQPVQIVAGVIGFIAVFVFLGVVGTVSFGWTNMVPIVACLEDDKRGTAAMGRAFELLKGNWVRVFGISLLLGLAIAAVMSIVGGLYALMFWPSLREIFSSPGGPSNSGVMGLALTFGGFYTLFFLLWNPAQNLVIAVLYLDLRVRREALDLEWTAYSSAPVPAVQNSALGQSMPTRALEIESFGNSAFSSGAATGAVEQLQPLETTPVAVENNYGVAPPAPSTFVSPAPSVFEAPAPPEVEAAPEVEAPPETSSFGGSSSRFYAGGLGNGINLSDSNAASNGGDGTDANAVERRDEERRD